MWRLIRLGLCGCILIGLLAGGASAYFLNRRPLSLDGAILNGGVPGSLLTSAGTWTFGPQNPDGNWDIVLNGVAQSPNVISAIQLYILNGGILYQLTAPGLWYSWTGAGPWGGPVSDPRPVSQTISSVNLSNSTFTPATANAAVGTVSVTMSPSSPTFTGSLSITGANSGGFHLAGTALQASASGTAAGTYSDLNIVATQGGISNSPQQISPSLTGGGGGGSVAAVTLTNGPPNIPNAAPGSCTTATCAWIGAGWPSGTHVSLVYADLTPISANYGGTFALSGANAGNFSISTSSDGTRNVGEIKTSGVLSAGDYAITVIATGAGGANTQNVTVHAASGTNVACGGSIPTSGTVLLAPGCAYTLHITNGISMPSVSANTVYIGVGNGSTIIDGGGDTCYAFQTSGTQTPGLVIIGIQFQNYGGACGNNGSGQFGSALLELADSSVVRNSRFINSRGKAMAPVGGGSQLLNNYVNHMGYGGIGPNIIPLPSSTALTLIQGNEIGDTNYLLTDTCNDSGAMKITGFNTATNVNIINNYFHDNAAAGPWPDGFHAPITASNNTFIRDGLSSFNLEQTRSGWIIDHNVMVHVGDGSSPTALPPACGGEGGQGAGINISGSAAVNAHDNNMSVYTHFDPILGANKSGQAFHFDDEIGNGAGFVGNNTIHDNTVNFFTSDGSASWGWNTSSEDTSGSSSNNNHFHLIGGNVNSDQHWYWFNQGNTAQTFVNYRASGQDANSTIDTTDTSATGCTHVACSGSGIGAGGVPN